MCRKIIATLEIFSQSYNDSCNARNVLAALENSCNTGIVLATLKKFLQ